MASTVGREHFLDTPKFLLGIRIAQLATAIAILGLSAYGVTFLSFDGDDLTLFTALATMIITVYVLVSTIWVPVLYNYWAILGLDIFAIVFWIISFSLLASEVAAYSWVTNYDYTDCYYGYCFKKRSGVEKRATTDVLTYRNAMAAASGLGGLEFILFVITLVVFSIRLHRHRQAGGHSMPASAAAAAAAEVEPKPQEQIIVVPVQEVQPGQQYVQVPVQQVPVQVVDQQFQQYPVQYQEVPQPSVSPVYSTQHQYQGTQPVDGLHTV
ncbi:hypothetical protein F5884DRAFT_89154 [Xylogone sp. PMI_703]|nr:hypothetical protein F5884DRAFT_89154 [Xylogone sp. PMI_703]